VAKPICRWEDDIKMNIEQT